MNASDRMAAFAKEKGINYPIAIDTKGETVKAFAVDSFPDYYVIDRAGKLRVADLANSELDRVVAQLLKEKVPGDGGSSPKGKGARKPIGAGN